MNVTLITHTPFPEKVIAAAAKLCYSDSDVETLMDGLTDEKAEAFVTKLAGFGVATEMLRLCCQVAPQLFETAGPACCCGACPEGKMSCGQAQQVRETFAALREEANHPSVHP